MRLLSMGDYAIDFDDVLWMHREPNAVVIVFRTPAGDKDRLVLTGNDAEVARAFMDQLPKAPDPLPESRPRSFSHAELTIPTVHKAASAE